MSKPTSIDYAVYVHGPSFPVFTYTASEILETVAESWRAYTEIEVVDETRGAEEVAFDVTTRAYRGKNWLFLAPPSAIKPMAMENVQVMEMPILGRILALDWFGYRTYTDYVEDFKPHIELALEDNLPMAIVVNAAPPTSLPYPRALPPSVPGKSYKKGPATEEVLRAYRPPDATDLRMLAYTHGLLPSSPIHVVNLKQNLMAIERIGQVLQEFEIATR
jgi:hypothetical protein